MTSAFDLPGLPPQSPATRTNWLGRYLSVEHKFDTELRDALSKAALATESKLIDTVGDNIGARTRRVQLAQARGAIRNIMKDLYGNVGDLIGDYGYKAARAATEAALDDESSLLEAYFKDRPQAISTYKQSMLQSAGKNVQAMVTRVLGFSKNPLSKRVYRTQALSYGWIDTAINNALVRGDSAKDLAKAVADLIDPNVPGGVSYAAMRLGRTEINNAFHAQSIKDAQEKPWVHSMTWHLSKVHSSDPKDFCEEYARIAEFPIDKVPNKPHPQCRCFVTPNQQDYQSFQHSLLMGQYDSYLDGILDAAGAAPASAPVKVAPGRGSNPALKKPKPVATNHVPKFNHENIDNISFGVPNSKGELVRPPDGPSGTYENPHMFTDESIRDIDNMAAYGRTLTKQDISEWMETLEGEDQLDMIRGYTSADFGESLAYYLRGREIPKGAPIRPASEKDAKAFDAIFHSDKVTPMPDWTVVTRGANVHDFGLTEDQVLSHEDLQKLTVGKTFTNPSYTSTSLSEIPAMGAQVRIVFRLPPGTRGIYVANDTRMSMLSDYAEEREVILPRNLKYKVLSAEEDHDAFNTMYYVVAEVIPDGK